MAPGPGRRTSPMKNPLLAVILLATALAPSPGARAAGEPLLRVDNTPVGDGRSPVVTSYADVLEPVQKAVVSIHLTKTIHIVNPLLRQFFGNVPGAEREGKETGLGSGVIVTADGYILTNNHVVEGADELTVSLPDNRTFTAKLIGSDVKTDIAVIKIDAGDLPTLTLADSDKLRVGDIVFAVGNPLEVGETVTMGIVSAKGRDLGLLDGVGGYENFIQTDAAINLGKSGGALVDAKGRLIGINSAIVSPSRGSIGLGFAVPINLAASVMRSLIATGSVKRGYLGVENPQDLTPELAEQFGLPKDSRGVIVTDITPGSPADHAGLRSSDVILAVNDTPVATIEEMHLAIGELAPGAQAALKVVRDGKSLTIKVILANTDENPNELLAGVTVEAITDDVRRRLDLDPRITGLHVTAVSETSPYAEILAPDMVIVSINQQTITDLATAREMIRPPGRYLLLIYYRGALSFVTLTVRKE